MFTRINVGRPKFGKIQVRQVMCTTQNTVITSGDGYGVEVPVTQLLFFRLYENKKKWKF